MRSIVLCEKPSQAANLRAAIGTVYGTILPASGHLYALAEPDHYGEHWKDWRSFTVYRPPEWIKLPTTGNDPNDRKRLNAAREAIAKALRGADRAYIATDADREGEVIGRELLEANGFAGEAFRILFTSEDPDSLKAAFASPIPLSEREPIYRAGLARERADFIWNFSLTRAATSALLTRDATSAVGIGRVKSAVLGIACRREIAVSAWKPSADHIVRLDIETPGGTARLTTDPSQTYPDKPAADAAIEKHRGEPIEITATATAKRQAPPKPPDLTTLQVTAAKWGWTAEKTLEVGQSLYSTHKIITYIRASTRAYPAGLSAEVPAILAGISACNALEAPSQADPVIRQGKGGTFSDAALAGESHHAIAPNYRTASDFARILPTLTDDEARLFRLICALFAECLAPDYEYESTTLAATFDDRSLSGTVTRALAPGWRAIRNDQPTGEDGPAILTAPVESGTYRPLDYGARPSKSKAPPRYTHGSLISAMSNAWQFVQAGDRRDRLKEAKGLGTVATRDQIIKGLLDQKQLTEAKKTIVPTNGGLDLFTLLYRLDPRLVDPATTAEWELKIDEIARGTLSLDDFLTEIATETAAVIKKIRQESQKIVFGAARKPTPSMIKAVEAIQKAKRTRAPAGWRTSYATAAEFLDAHASRQEQSR